MKLFIDPGHGGEDPGAIGPTSLVEKDWNFQVSVWRLQRLGTCVRTDGE